jgi:hypothetical protein
MIDLSDYRRPFHETLVEVMRGFVGSDVAALPLVALIKLTKIPKNHDEIIVAWQDLMKRLHFSEEWDIFGVVEDLNRQKREAEAEVRQKHEAEMREIASDARSDCS